jgi:Putative holin
VRVIVESVIPLPRAWLLASAMLVGTAFGLLAGIASTLLITATIRPDVVIALVVGVPSAIGMLMILFSGRRWVTTLGAFILAIAPGWFGVLVAIQVVHGA